MQGAAHFSPCGTWRYLLTRQWASEGTTLRVVMLNPSTADAVQLDPTVRRCVGFARSWGHARLVVLNAYALRSTDPRGLWTHPEPVGEGIANDLHIRAQAQLAAAEGIPLLAAWGVHAQPERVARIVELVEGAGAHLVCLGTTKEGAPRHPLYVAASTRPEAWSPPPVEPLA